MGNWCTLTHWFACPGPAEARAVIGGLRTAAARHRWTDPERWALRAGMLGPTLVQAESLQKYGADTSLAEHALRHARDVRVVQLCAGEGVAVGPRGGPGLHLAWNYVASSAAHDLHAVAARLGGEVVDAGERRVLCLPGAAPLALAGGRLAQLVERDDPLGRLLYALAVGDRGGAGHTGRHLLGLYTPEHGFVHLATLVLALADRHWEHSGHASFEDGAGHNPVHPEFAAGPFARSSYFEPLPPISLAHLRWPLA